MPISRRLRTNTTASRLFHAPPSTTTSWCGLPSSCHDDAACLRHGLAFPSWGRHRPQSVLFFFTFELSERGPWPCHFVSISSHPSHFGAPFRGLRSAFGGNSEAKEVQDPRLDAAVDANWTCAMEEDDRFAHARTDPRFRRLPKEQRKVAVDARFRDAIEGKGLFRTERAKVDKRGAPVREDTKRNRKGEGGKYYRLEEREEEEENQAQVDTKQDANEEEEEDLEYMGIRFPNLEAKQRYLRLRGLDGSDGEEEQDDREDESDSDAIFSDAVSESTDSGGEEVWGVGAYAGSLYGVTKHEENIPDIEEETHRLAVVDMDWDRVKAMDLFAALHSFVPKRGTLRSVTIYPSDYGLERMKEEETKGPSIFRDEDKSKQTQEDDSSSGEDVEDAKLRAYERSKLRYYYAIAEFDSEKTAAVVYKECDGMEFEKTATKFDLRFVPVEQDFSGREVKESAYELPSGYEAPVFETKSLQHSKPQLTWDADDEPRTKLLKKKLSEDAIKEEDLKAYIASTEEESEEEEEGLSSKAAVLRELLIDGEKGRADKEWGKGGGGSEEEGNMEITFDSGLENLSKRILEEKRDAKQKQGESVWQTYMRRKKEKARSRKSGKRGNSSEEDNSDDMYIDNPAHDDAKQLSEDEFFMDEKKPSDKESLARLERKEAELAEARKQQELELLMLDDNHLHDIARGNSKPNDTTANNPLSGKSSKKKKKRSRNNPKESEEEDNTDLNKKGGLKINVDDPRFAALYTSHHYALDPTDPRYKKDSAAVKQITEERVKRREAKIDPSEAETTPKADGISSDVKAMVMALKTKDKRQKLKKQMHAVHKG